MHRRAHRRKESGKQGEESGSEEGKIRRVAQMKECEDEKEKRKESEEEEMVRRKEMEEEEKIMAQAHSLLLTMDSMLSLEGETLLYVYQLKIPSTLGNSTKAQSQIWLVHPSAPT